MARKWSNYFILNFSSEVLKIALPQLSVRVQTLSVLGTAVVLIDNSNNNILYIEYNILYIEFSIDLVRTDIGDIKRTILK